MAPTDRASTSAATSAPLYVGYTSATETAKKMKSIWGVNARARLSDVIPTDFQSADEYRRASKAY
jgi:hypothetical protein